VEETIIIVSGKTGEAVGFDVGAGVTGVGFLVGVDTGIGVTGAAVGDVVGLYRASALRYCLTPIGVRGDTCLGAGSELKSWKSSSHRFLANSTGVGRDEAMLLAHGFWSP
jgi:hypothetical protein